MAISVNHNLYSINTGNYFQHNKNEPLAIFCEHRQQKGTSQESLYDE
jgi:hypothetical protein